MGVKYGYKFDFLNTVEIERVMLFTPFLDPLLVLFYFSDKIKIIKPLKLFIAWNGEFHAYIYKFLQTLIFHIKGTQP